MTRNSIALAVAAAIASPLMSHSAWAQEKPEATNLDEVVVTAQKISQSVIDVPLSISVLGGDDLERTQSLNMQDYTKFVPGLQLTQSQPGFGRLVLRGINTNGVASTVGVYVDETTFGSSSGLANGAILAGDFDTFDVARVEVLRGPQGTLYGASSLGGVLKYVTNEPQTESFEGRVRGSFESVDGGDMSYSGAGVVNIPVSDSVAIRASGFYRSVGGFIDSIGTVDEASGATSDVADNINGSTVSGGRASMLFKPSETFSLQLTAFIQDIDNDASSGVDSDYTTAKTLYGGLTQSQFVPEAAGISYRVYNATAIWDLGFADLTSATSYGENTQDFRQDITMLLGGLESYIEQTTGVKRITQELRLASHENEKVDWLVGAYYNDEDGLIYQNVHVVEPGTLTDIPLFLGEGTIDSKYKEYAAFANVTIKFTSTFDLTLGGRYSNNDQDVVQNADGPLFGVAEPTVTTSNSSEDVFTYSIAPKFKLNDRMAIYARVAKGFRPGGPNVIAPDAGAPTSYGSDSTLNYELGFKGESEARNFAWDVSAFHIDWEDIQLLAVVNGIGINTNAGTATSDGVEASLMFRPVDQLKFSLTGAYTDAKLTEDADPILVGGRDGDHLPYTPKISYSASADYEWPLADGRSAYLGASFSHLDDVPAAFSAAYVAQYGEQRYLPSYDTVDVRAGWDFGKVSVELFGRNLTNEDGKTSDGSGNTPNGAISTAVIRPLSYGLTVTAEF
jgi:iron complex outermembrane recepter protein